MKNNKITISFTGHRPNKLYGYNYTNGGNKKIMLSMYKKLKELTENHDEIHFIEGGALGIDQMGFIVCNKLKKDYPNKNISIEVTVPFESQDNNWINSSKQLYRNQLRLADKVTQVDTLDDYMINGYTVGKYYPAKMQKRNMYMVDNSDIVLSVWDGSNGGTGNCVSYAMNRGKKIINLNPKTFKWNDIKLGK